MNHTPAASGARVRTFVQRFSSTPRGARLARRLATHQLDAWGVPHGSVPSERVAVIVAELAANAVTHGRVPGRDFELRLTCATGRGPGAARTVRIEVSDTRGERRPPKPGDVAEAPPFAESGRGLVLVDALASRWDVVDRVPGPGKTVIAELDVRSLMPSARPGGQAAL